MPSNSDQGKRTIGAFDIRFVIGALLGVYGLILIFLGLFNATEAELKRGDGLNINLWAGLGMLVVGVAFAAWALWRPMVVPVRKEEPAPPKD